MLRLGTHELTPREIAAAITAPDQALFYLSAVSAEPGPTSRARRDRTRVVLIPRSGLAELQAAQRSWCAAATAELGEPVSHIDVEALLRPRPGSRWAATSADLRAGLLTRALGLVEAHASELGTFDPRDLGIAVDGVALEHIFFGLVAHRASCEDLEVILLAPGGEDRWWLRLVFTETGRVWRRGVVLAPTGALAGVELAALAGEVVARVQDRRHGPRVRAHEEDVDDVDDEGDEGDEGDAGRAADSPGSPPLAPELEAALQAGASLLAPRISTLIPPETGPLLH